jgi:cytidylate kinase
MKHFFVLTIDGPAGSGKSTVAKRLAQALRAILLDTGAIYRSLALVAQKHQVAWTDGPGLAELASHLDLVFHLEGASNRVMVNGEDVTAAIRTPEISRGASLVSSLREVRQALLELQRKVREEGPVVAEGRDMGTVVFPDAPIKIFLTADPLVRARRRQQELQATDQDQSLEQVLEEQSARDAADAGREEAPLRAAEDAMVLDSSHLGQEQVVEQILAAVRRQFPQGISQGAQGCPRS